MGTPGAEGFLGGYHVHHLRYSYVLKLNFSLPFFSFPSSHQNFEATPDASGDLKEDNYNLLVMNHY